jgi:salicylate hydroxylase
LEEHAPQAIHYGARYVGFEQDGAGVTLLLEDGARASGDALIGADGVHSCVREKLFGDDSATFTGFMAWRAVVPMDRLPTRLRQQNFVAWSGPRAQLVTYPLRRGELLNFVGSVMRDDWLIESWSQAGAIEECRNDFAQWHEDVLALIDVMGTPYKWALLGRQPLPTWTVGRVSLLGDAAHPMLPYLGQGANMAIEDGMVLARCLEASADIHVALRRYEAARLGRTSQMVLASLENGARMHNPQLAEPEAAIAFMDRQYAPSALANRYDWLYEYDAMAATI